MSFPSVSQHFLLLPKYIIVVSNKNGKIGHVIAPSPRNEYPIPVSVTFPDDATDNDENNGKYEMLKRKED